MNQSSRRSLFVHDIGTEFLKVNLVVLIQVAFFQQLIYEVRVLEILFFIWS